MSKIAAEWASVLATIQQKQQQPTYMASAILSLISCLDRGEGESNSAVCVSRVLEVQEQLLRNAGCEQLEPAFQGVFHLSGTAAVWTFELNGIVADFSSLPRQKPRSPSQLLEHADRLRIERNLQKQLATRAHRTELAKAVARHLRESDSDSDGDVHKLADYAERLFS